MPQRISAVNHQGAKATEFHDEGEEGIGTRRPQRARRG